MQTTTTTFVDGPRASFTRARRRAWLRSSTFLVACPIALAAVFAASSLPAQAQTNWTGATSNDWYTGSNWDNGVPIAGTDATIRTITPNGTVISGLGPGGLGAFGSTIAVGTGLFGNGNLAIQNGGTLTSSFGHIGEGSLSATGAVTVNGPGSTWTFTTASVGIDGGGTLNVVNGGTAGGVFVNFGVNAGSIGTSLVRGAGSDLRGTNGVAVGLNGEGHLTLADGGTVTSNSAISLAQSVGSIGVLNIGNAPANPAQAPGTVNAPGVQFGAGSGTINFNHTATNYVFAPTIAGSGDVNVVSGTTILTAANTYTGTTIINSGRLVVAGSILSTTFVGGNGTLAGDGGVGTVTVGSGGTLAPGPVGAPGNMNVGGVLTLQPGANYLVQVAGTSASRADVAGAANLGGTVQAQIAGGAIANSYTILTSAALNGTTFAGVTSNNPNFGVSLSYTTTNVLLNLTAMLGTGGGLNQNQQNVANVINTAFNNGTLPPAFAGIVGLTGASLSQALSQTSGEVATGAPQGALQLMNQFLGVMLDPFVNGRGAGSSGPAMGYAQAPAASRVEVAAREAFAADMPVKTARVPYLTEQRYAVWGAAYGGQNRTNGDPVVGSNNLTARAGGVAGGLDYRVGPGTTVGFAVAGGGTDWRLANALGKGRSDAVQAGLYSTTRMGPAYLAAALAYTGHWMETDRFAFAGNHLVAKFTGQSFGARVESGWRFAVANGGFTPYAAGQGQVLRTPSYVENDLNNGGFGLAFAARSATAIRSELGARFDQSFAVTASATFALFGRVAWAHDWVSDPSLNPVFQALPGAGFIVNGATPAKNLALTSAGAEWRLANFSIAAKFDGEFASGSATYSGTGTVRVTW